MTIPQLLPPLRIDQPPDTRRVWDYTVKPSSTRNLFAFLGLSAVQVDGLGGDVSKWQPEIDWAKAAAAGWLFAFIRAAYGENPDSKFSQHWPGAKGKLLRGLYLYYLDAENPLQQAQKVFELCGGDLGEMPPVLDLEEYGNAQLTTLKVRQCLDKLEDLFNKTPIIYTGTSVWNKWFGKQATWGLAYPLWLAQYTLIGWQSDHLNKVLNYPPTLPQPFFEFEFWQFSASAPASQFGVSGSVVDVNYAAPGVLAKYGTPPPPIVPPPPDPIPDPIGVLQMEFINTGGDISNIRAAPLISTLNIIGKLPDGAKFTALELKFTAGYAWAKYTLDPVWLLPGKTGLTGWSALVVISGNPLIDFSAALPCPGENEMYVTLEEMTAAIAEALTSLVTNPPMTHKVVTTAPNGVKLRAYPGGSEAAMLANSTQVRLLIDKTWNEHKLYAAFIGNVWVSGWLKSDEVAPL